MNFESTIVFWFRRDLRIFDNVGLEAALIAIRSFHKQGKKIRFLPLFIFDPTILDPLPPDDHRVNLIYQSLKRINFQFNEHGFSLTIRLGKPVKVFTEIISSCSLQAVYTNEDYEPYARDRDDGIRALLKSHSISFHRFTDQVIFSPGEVLKDDGNPYTIFTPFKNRWLSKIKPLSTYPSEQLLKEMGVNELTKGKNNLSSSSFPTKKDLGIIPAQINIPPVQRENIADYDQHRNFPGDEKGRTYAGVYLRFGLVSIRDLVITAFEENPIFLSELIWREFFMHILWHFPQTVEKNFKPQYDSVKWRNHPEEFETWCKGETGYPLVDAGMRELNQTGFMSNRVRMVTASFLCKHLLIDWRWGERYFAKKLFDFELASNVGNWQWSAGTGCDAAPYFRIFNPEEQAKKFDPKNIYIKKWLPGFPDSDYPHPMVEHKLARERALKTYRVVKG